MFDIDQINLGKLGDASVELLKYPYKNDVYYHAGSMKMVPWPTSYICRIKEPKIEYNGATILRMSDIL